MERKDFQCSQLDRYWYDNMSPPYQFNVGRSSNNSHWSSEENKVFENALAHQVEVVGSPAFFQSLATIIPNKSMEDIKIHFEALVKDIEMIESDIFPIPEYKTQEDMGPLTTDLLEETNDKNEKRSASYDTKKKCSNQRRRGVPWTEEEHQLFLMGLNKYGKGDWRSISRYYVNSKTPTQIASHAQKYFRRQTSTTPMDKRRPSIHDIQTVAYPATNMLLPTFNNNSSSAPAPVQMSFQRTTFLMNNSMSGVNINLEQNPAMFVPDGRINSIHHMPLSSMNNHQWDLTATNLDLANQSSEIETPKTKF